VIPGLYATGTSSASVMGPVEAGGGGSIGPSFTWAYVAARHAARAEQLVGSFALAHEALGGDADQDDRAHDGKVE
jgi:hypothetical protein